MGLTADQRILQILVWDLVAADTIFTLIDAVIRVVLANYLWACTAEQPSLVDAIKLSRIVFTLK